MCRIALVAVLAAACGCSGGGSGAEALAEPAGGVYAVVRAEGACYVARLEPGGALEAIQAIPEGSRAAIDGDILLWTAATDGVIAGVNLVTGERMAFSATSAEILYPLAVVRP